MISFGVNTAIFISTVRFSNIWYKSTRMRDLEQQNTFSSQQRGNWDENRGCVLAASVVSSLPFQAEVGIAPKDESRTRNTDPESKRPTAFVFSDKIWPLKFLNSKTISVESLPILVEAFGNNWRKICHRATTTAGEVSNPHWHLTCMKVNAGAGPASGSRGPRTPKQLGRSGVPVPVPPPPALQQGAPHDEHRHSSAAHEALRSQTRMLLSQVKRALSSHQLTGILQGQENLICKVPCSFMQLLYSLLSFFSRRGGWQLDSWKHNL